MRDVLGEVLGYIAEDWPIVVVAYLALAVAVAISTIISRLRRNGTSDAAASTPAKFVVPDKLWYLQAAAWTLCVLVAFTLFAAGIHKLDGTDIETWFKLAAAVTLFG
ncbi:MAG: hypothetical protein AAF747_04725, partial [Planctomycetota bacterium]